MKINKYYSPDFGEPDGDGIETIDNSSDKNLIKDVAESSDFDFDTELSNLISDSEDDDIDQEKSIEKKAKDFAPNDADSSLNDDKEDEPLYKVLAEQLKSEGLFDDEDFASDDDFEFDGSPESFKYLMERRDFKRGLKIFEEVVSEMPAKMRTQFQLFMDGLDEDSASDIGSKLVDYSNVTKEDLESNPAKAEQLYRELLRTKGFSNEKINKYVERARDLDELADEGLEAAQLLNQEVQRQIQTKKQEEQYIAQRRQQEAGQRLQALKSAITQTPEIFKGVPLTDKMKDQLYKSMTETVAYDENKQPLNKVAALSKRNPEAFRMQLHYLTELGLFNTDERGNLKPDLTKLMRLAETKVSRSIDDRLKKAAFRSGSNLSNNISEKESDVLSSLEHFLKNK
jgi:DNA-binding transcriptional MerR regulator